MARRERQFTFRSGKSQKFWNIAVKGTSLTVRFGRIGTSGQERTTKFHDAGDAKRASEKLVREKVAKGYIATWAPGDPDYDAHFAKYGHLREEAEAKERAWRKGFDKLPRRVKRALSWDEIESEVRKTYPGRAANATVATVPGLSKRPPSYVEFASRFTDVGEWRITHRKRAWPWFFYLTPKSMAKDRARLISTYETEAPRKAARVRELIPFASDASETYFCWDSTAVDWRGEPAVYAADFKHPYAILRLGRDLLEVIQHYRPDWF
jgi:predicted DNA-binding WGR domain protein